jgi:uncharacterized protein
MDSQTPVNWIAFGGKKRIACGPPRQVAEQLVALVASHPNVSLQILDATSSQAVELDLQGSAQAVLRRVPREPAAAAGAALAEAPPDAARGPGRPKLGVVAREVTLLPRHWDWLTAQPGGASVALRKLVEQALRSTRESERVRLATEAAYRFMHTMAGDEPGFEEASRALFANEPEKCLAHMAKWPKDVRAHAASLIERMACPAGERQDGPAAASEPGRQRVTPKAP